MSYKVICPLAVILNEDKETYRHLYAGGLIGDDFSGFDPDTVKRLAEEGYLEDEGKSSKSSKSDK